MTESTHTYRAYLIADPDDVELPNVAGTIRLDAASAPHVTASLTVSAPGVWEFTPVEYPDGEGFGYGEGEYGAGGYGGYGTEFGWTPDEIALEALDPRLNARVRIEVEAVSSFGTVTRTFNLGVRDRSISHRDAQITLELASDEALLGEWAPLADDDTRAYQTSLRDVIDYVLDSAMPGAALEASPANDEDVTVYWEVTNLVANPNGANTTGVAGGTGTSTFTATTHLGDNALRWENTAGDTGAYIAGWDTSGSAFTQIPVRPGESYAASALLSSSIARSAQIGIQWRAADNTFMGVAQGATATTSTGAWTLYTAMGTAPNGAAYAALVVFTAGNSAGQHHYSRQAMLYQDTEVIPSFDGDTTDGTDGYLYAWEGDPDLSSSTRTPIIDRPREALIWRAGQYGIDFLAPLVQSFGLRLVCDELRQWTLRDEDYTADGSVSVRHAVNMTDADERISRGSGIWFDAAVAEYRWSSAGVEHVRTDTHALATPYTRLRLFEFDTPYPGAGFAEYAVRRAQQRGREINASAVSDWNVVAEQSVTIYMDDTPAQVGKTESVVFNLDDDEMTLSARTQDTPDGAIDLLLGTIDSLVGTIDGL